MSLVYLWTPVSKLYSSFGLSYLQWSCTLLEEIALCCSSPAHSVRASHSFFHFVIKRMMISTLIPYLFTVDSSQNSSSWTGKRWRMTSNSSSHVDFCSCKGVESISFLFRCSNYTSANTFCQHIKYWLDDVGINASEFWIQTKTAAPKHPHSLESWKVGNCMGKCIRCLGALHTQVHMHCSFTALHTLITP